MCGGLVTASCAGGKDVLKYQVGRLLGYSLMGTSAYLLGYAMKGLISFSWAPFLSGIFLGTLFIYWGIQSYQGKKAELPLPGFLRKTYQYLFRNFALKAGSFRSFFVGFISILLPCGLIYGLIISALALGEFRHVMISLFFFWLGTLPAMVGAPGIVRKVLEPMRKKLPVVYALVFIVIGVSTIAGRLGHLPQARAEVEHHCH
jgi:sulfite exporter TauE/SafE